MSDTKEYLTSVAVGIVLVCFWRFGYEATAIAFIGFLAMRILLILTRPATVESDPTYNKGNVPHPKKEQPC